MCLHNWRGQCLKTIKRILRFDKLIWFLVKRIIEKRLSEVSYLTFSCTKKKKASNKIKSILINNLTDLVKLGLSRVVLRQCLKFWGYLLTGGTPFSTEIDKHRHVSGWRQRKFEIFNICKLWNFCHSELTNWLIYNNEYKVGGNTTLARFKHHYY